MVFVNPADIETLGLTAGDRSTWFRSGPTSTAALQERRAKDFLVVEYSTPVGNAAAYYPETNPLSPAGSHSGEIEHPGIEGDYGPTGVGCARASLLAVKYRVGHVTARRRATHLTADQAITRPETLAVEEPLEIRVNGAPVTVTMRTPGSDIELAQGFLLTEGVITDRDDVLTIRYCGGRGEDGANTYNVLDVTLAAGVKPPDLDVTRNFYTTSSCGVCGKASLDAVRVISRFSPGDDPATVAAATLKAMPGQLRGAQKVFDSTGGLHAAALFAAGRRDAGGARGHRQAQRRRQGHRLGAGT